MEDTTGKNPTTSPITGPNNNVPCPKCYGNGFVRISRSRTTGCDFCNLQGEVPYDVAVPPYRL